ncbi:MAG: hypothetical protein F4Y50_01430 [Dehalococcoidia bacterium]|nr:hypothetical protein [Dehalococcoidia bacterium]
MTRDYNHVTAPEGGRVLTFRGSGPTPKEARRRAYAAAERTKFNGSFFRNDIADFAKQ